MFDGSYDQCVYPVTQ